MTASTHNHDGTDHDPTATHRTREDSIEHGWPAVASASRPESEPAGDEYTTEADTDRDGFASYPAEVHALTHGIYMGLTSRPLVHPPEPDNRDVQKESHYYRGGYVIGTVFQIAIIGLLFTLTKGAM